MATTALAPLEPAAEDVELPNAVFDRLFHQYTIKLRRAGLESFILASIMFDLWAVCVPQGQDWICTGITLCCMGINILHIIFLRLFRHSNMAKTAFDMSPFSAWSVATIQLCFHLIFKGFMTPRDSLGWAILLNFLIYVALPVPTSFMAFMLGSGSMCAHILTTTLLSKREVYFERQHFANAMLLISANALGLMNSMLTGRKHLRSFREAKKSLEVKMVIEEQSAEQERLLLSVLPEHVAVKMRQDLGSNDSEQFKKIYMSRHENVSILYADIVGFTAISSTYSAQDLVKMLNELFARFDRLAEKYHQLRIKILGDCYYCISGAPIERPDHAALCVYMGLSMVKAIKYVQKKTNSPVDMRVGIHTGAILAGILGQRQWQFDVYSKDVELANKMESSGLAGRVHISEKTLSYLKDEFEVEPAFGEKREETLRIAGLKTFFIKKVLIPFTATKEVADTSNTNGIANAETVESITTDAPSIISNDEDSKTHSVENGDPADDSCYKENDFKQRLKVELLSRDRHSELANETNIWLQFKNPELETAFTNHCEPMFTIPHLGFPFIIFTGSIAMTVFLQSSFMYFFASVSVAFCFSTQILLSVSEYFPTIFSSKFVSMSHIHNRSIVLRNVNLITVVMLTALSNCARMFCCNYELPQLPSNSSNLSGFDFEQMPSPRYVCVYPSYFSNYAVLMLITITSLAQISHLFKIALMLFITGTHCWMNIWRLEENFLREDVIRPLPGGYNMSAMLVAITIALGWVSRHMDKEDRVIFKWKTEVSEQKEKATDMRRRNEALVYNILPVHVAEHFMRNKARSYDELYSQSYDEVGVLFASMPNFSDFYSEDTVNNQGLECLRFLNEVISDFDALLEVPRFQDVIKIKTIGSTYMAASGLNPTRQMKPEDSITMRWEHLALLVDFALELKKALQCINEQSFNHFVLKMGINHGPITAGVIGARKPHYDIWGNTVNVASRMESTGKAGAVQVTEETCHILQTFGYTFEQRGLVAVKGKGELMTYYLQGKTVRPTTSVHNSPILSNINPMETLPEVDESRDSQSSDQNTAANHNGNTPSKHLKSPSLSGKSKFGPISKSVKNGDAPVEKSNSADEADGFDPVASTPLLVDEGNNSSNANANDFGSGDSEKDALIISSTSGN